MWEDPDRVLPVELNVTTITDPVGRYQSIYGSFKKWQQEHSPEHLSTLGLKDLLEQLPENTIVSVDPD